MVSWRTWRRDPLPFHDSIGVIGVGLLGSAIAQRLISNGKQVIGYDLECRALENFVALGGLPETSAGHTFRRCSQVVLCLPNSDAVEAVLAENDKALAPGALIVDCTTGDPEQMASAGERLFERGVEYVDASVGGSSEQVRARESIVMAGGTECGFALAQPLVAAFSKSAFHIGTWGSGARMKLVLNMVLGLHRAVLAEGLAFACSLGIDAGVALEILRAGPAHSVAMDVKGAKMLARDYTPQARLSQHLKDVRLMLAAGRRTGARLPLTKTHEGLLDELVRRGYADSDNSSILEAFNPQQEAAESPASTTIERQKGQTG